MRARLREPGIERLEQRWHTGDMIADWKYVKGCCKKRDNDQLLSLVNEKRVRSRLMLQQGNIKGNVTRNFITLRTVWTMARTAKRGSATPLNAQGWRPICQGWFVNNEVTPSQRVSPASWFQAGRSGAIELHHGSAAIHSAPGQGATPANESQKMLVSAHARNIYTCW